MNAKKSKKSKLSTLNRDNLALKAEVSRLKAELAASIPAKAAQAYEEGRAEGLFAVRILDSINKGYWVDPSSDIAWNPGNGRKFAKRKLRRLERRQQRKIVKEALEQYHQEAIEDVAEADFLLYMEEERRQADEEAYVSMFMRESEDGDVFVAGYDFGDYRDDDVVFHDYHDTGDGEVFEEGQTMLITNQDGKDIPGYACATFKYKGFDIAFDRTNAFIWCGMTMLYHFDTVEEAIAKIDGGMK